jgi:predicted nucleotidyltransferase
MVKINLSKSQLEKFQLLGKKYNLRVLILFGSRAKGTERKDSDWDLAYYPLKSDFDADEDSNLFNDILNILKTEKVDLLNLKKSNNLLVIKNSLKDAIALYEHKEGTLSSMRWSAWIDYQDFRKYIDLKNDLVKNNLREIAANGN